MIVTLPRGEVAEPLDTKGGDPPLPLLLLPHWQWFPGPGSYFFFYGNFFLSLSLSLSGFSFCYAHIRTIYIYIYKKKFVPFCLRKKKHRNTEMAVSDTSQPFVSLWYVFFHRSERETTFEKEDPSQKVKKIYLCIYLIYKKKGCNNLNSPRGTRLCLCRLLWRYKASLRVKKHISYSVHSCSILRRYLGRNNE